MCSSDLQHHQAPADALGALAVVALVPLGGAGRLDPDALGVFGAGDVPGPPQGGVVVRGDLVLPHLAWLMTGLFLLILTPVLRVVASIVAFAKEGDKLYVAITTLVLIILIVAMFVGHGGA